MKENTMSITRAQLREIILKEASFDPDRGTSDDDDKLDGMDWSGAVAASAVPATSDGNTKGDDDVEDDKPDKPDKYDYEIDQQQQDESTIMTVGQFRKLIREVASVKDVNDHTDTNNEISNDVLESKIEKAINKLIK